MFLQDQRLDKCIFWITTRTDETLLANQIRDLWVEWPQYGYRKITKALRRDGYEVNHKKTLRLMQDVGIQSMYQKPKTSNHNKVSIDGRGRWVDNVFSERFWRTLKHEHVLLHEFETVSEARDSSCGQFLRKSIVISITEKPLYPRTIVQRKGVD